MRALAAQTLRVCCPSFNQTADLLEHTRKACAPVEDFGKADRRVFIGLEPDRANESRDRAPACRNATRRGGSEDRKRACAQHQYASRLEYRRTTALATVSVSVSVTARPLALTLPDARVGTAYSQTFSASNGTAPYTFRASGALPARLALASDHRLSGTPWSVGTYYFLVNVSDSAGRDITELRTIQSLA